MSGRRVIRGLYFQFYCFFYGYLSPFTFLLSLHEKVRFYTFLKMKNHKVSYSILQNHKVSYFIVHICVIFLHMYKQLLLSDQVEPWHFLWDSKRDFNFPIPTSLDLDLHIYSLDWDAKQNTFMPNYWNDWKYDAEQWLNCLLLMHACCRTLVITMTRDCLECLLWILSWEMEEKCSQTQEEMKWDEINDRIHQAIAHAMAPPTDK